MVLAPGMLLWCVPLLLWCRTLLLWRRSRLHLPGLYLPGLHLPRLHLSRLLPSRLHLWLRPAYLRLRSVHLRPVHHRITRPVHTRIARPVHLWPRPVHLRPADTRTTRPVHIRIIRPVHHRITRPAYTRIVRSAHRIIRPPRIYSRSRHRRRTRPSMIQPRKTSPITHRLLLLLRLHIRPLDMPLIHRHLLTRIRPALYAARTTVIAHTIYRHIVHDRPIDIRIVDNRRIHPRHRRIIPETPAIPFATVIPHTAITTTVIDPAIISDMRTPITGVPSIDSTIPAPVPGRPQESHLRRRLPISRHPIIILGILIPGPVTRDPDISINRTGRLNIYRNSRRGYSHGYAHAYLRTRSCSRKYNG